MIEDDETQKVKSFGDFKKQVSELQREVRSLKTRLGKLIGRVEQLENMGFQDQITSLGDKLKQLKVDHDMVTNLHAKQILDTNRAALALKVNSDVAIIIDIINTQLSQRTDLFSQILADAASTKVNIITSTKPVDMYTAFKNKWDTILKQFGAKLISY